MEGIPSGSIIRARPGSISRPFVDCVRLWASRYLIQTEFSEADHLADDVVIATTSSACLHMHLVNSTENGIAIVETTSITMVHEFLALPRFFATKLQVFIQAVLS